MGLGDALSAAHDATVGKFDRSSLQLKDEDIDRIAEALTARSRPYVGFHLFDFCLGIMFTVGIAMLFFTKLRRRFMRRKNERDAVELLKNMDDDSIKRLFGDSDLPSWVNFPDFERVGWINKVLSQLWPYINSAVSQQFREILSPKLRENKPSWISTLKLFRFDLGDTAPQANGVKVYQNADQTGEIIVEVDFSWVGNQDVQLTIKPIPKHLGPLSPAGHILSSIIRLRGLWFEINPPLYVPLKIQAGIERITVNGSLRLMWKPLLGELPVVGGMQAALVEMPNFSFDVTIYGGDASLVPGLEQWLTQFMKDTVFRPYILPDRYTHSFTSAAEMEDLRPKGILFLKVLEARHVPKMDLFSQSDTYIKLSVRHAIQLRTSIKQNNANPKWDESFKVLVHHPESQVLTCILMDFDDYNPDDEIGRVMLPIKDLESETTHDFWLDVDLHADEESAAEHQDNKGIIGTAFAIEQKVAAQGEKVWKRLPGVKKKDKSCQLHLQATLYLLESDDLEEAVRQDEAAGMQQERRESSEVGTTAHSAPDNAQQPHPHSHSAQGARDVSFDSDSRSKDGSPATAPTSREPSATENGPTKGDPMDRKEKKGAHQNDERSKADQAGDKSKPSDAESTQQNGKAGDQQSPDGEGPPSSQEHDAPQEHKQPLPASKKVSMTTEEHEEVRKEALDALKGGILYVKPRKAESLKRKPWYKSFFLHSQAQLEVTVCGQHKTTASATGSNPIFSETLEFLLGGKDIEGAEHSRLKIEVWDHRLHLNHFRGGCSLILKDIINAKCIKNTLRLSGAQQGELSLEVYWIAALESARGGHKSPQAGAVERK